MGNRANVQFTDGHDVSPSVYLHNMGGMVQDLLSETKALMGGRNDLEYIAARFVGVCCSKDPNSGLSIGMQNEKNTDIVDHGDAGVFIVDINTWTAKVRGLKVVIE